MSDEEKLNSLREDLLRWEKVVANHQLTVAEIVKLNDKLTEVAAPIAELLSLAVVDSRLMSVVEELIDTTHNCQKAIVELLSDIMESVNVVQDRYVLLKKELRDLGVSIDD